MRPSARLAGLAFAALVAAAGVLASANPPAFATSQGVQIAAGWVIQGAEVTSASQTKTTQWNANQAATFFVSWYPAQLYGKLTAQTPPAGLPRHTVTITDTVNGTPQHIVVYYETDGHNAWVMLPLQTLGPGAFVNRLVWDRAPQRTIDAFNNRPGVPATTPATPGSAAPHSSGNSSTGPILVAVAIGVVLIGLVLYFTQRRRARSRAGSTTHNTRNSRQTARRESVARR